MPKFLKTNDREVLEKIFDVYKSIHEKVPTPDPKLMGVALKQLGANAPQPSLLKVEDFIDRRPGCRTRKSKDFVAKICDGC